MLVLLNLSWKEKLNWKCKKKSVFKENNFPYSSDTKRKCGERSAILIINMIAKHKIKIVTLNKFVVWLVSPEKKNKFHSEMGYFYKKKK